jgi:bifunctional DNA-binding transcriptional regulator/antitoxin component of YhaV-PrlF toxin-antitoxin module|tara:strand:+ start:2456 stop:2689 length:234 start_codon:yes stop_codon:yes gene_type:complete
MALKTFEYKAEEIFQDIPGDNKNVNMVIPPAILEAQGWKVGDKLKFDVGDKGTIIITKPDEAKEDDQNVVVITQPNE